MAGFRDQGSLCATTAPASDSGTLCRGRSPAPGPLGQGANRPAFSPNMRNTSSGGAGGPLAIGMLRDLIFAAAPTKESRASADPIANAIVTTQVNFLFCNPEDVRAKVSQNAKLLGGQNKTNDVLNRLGDFSEFANSVLGAIYVASQAQNVDPRTLAAVLFTEIETQRNLAVIAKRLKRLGYKGTVDSYYALGLDSFANDYKRLKDEGYLPVNFSNHNQFEISKISVTNDAAKHKSLVRIVVFRDMTSAVMALAAIFGDRRAKMQAALSKLDIKESDLTADEMDFWNYVFFNSSYPDKNLADEVKSNIEKTGAASAKVPSRFIEAPDKNSRALGNAQRMLAIKQLLTWAGMVDPFSEG
jgi:hypothetical protein